MHLFLCFISIPVITYARHVPTFSFCFFTPFLYSWFPFLSKLLLLCYYDGYCLFLRKNCQNICIFYFLFTFPPHTHVIHILCICSHLHCMLCKISFSSSAETIQIVCVSCHCSSPLLSFHSLPYGLLTPVQLQKE